MREALKSVVRDVPYASFASALRLDGYGIPEKIGGDCLYMCHKLREQVHGDVDRVAYLPAGVEGLGPHYALLANNLGDQYLCDPYAMHIEPFSVNEIRSNQENFGVAPSLVENRSVGLRLGRAGKFFNLSFAEKRNATWHWRPSEAIFSLDHAHIHTHVPDELDPEFIRRSMLESVVRLRFFDNEGRFVVIDYTDTSESIEMEVVSGGMRLVRCDVARAMIEYVNDALARVGDRFDNMDMGDLIMMMKHAIRIRADL